MKIPSMLLLTCMGSSAWAQCPGLLRPLEVEEQSAPGNEPVRFGGGSPLSSIDSGRSFFSIKAGNQDSKGILAYAMTSAAAKKVSSSTTASEGEVETTAGCSQALTFSFSVPIGKDKTTAKVSTLDSFANVYKFKVAFTRYSDKFRVQTERMNAMHARLKADAKDEGIAFNRANMEKHYGENHAFLRDFDKLVTSQTVFYGVDYEFGRKQYEYVDLLAFQELEDDYTSWAASAYAGREFGKWLVSGKLSFGQDFTSNDEVFQCRQSADTPNLSCLQGFDGAPEKEDSLKLTFEVRKQFRHVGVSPTFYHDFERDVSGIDIPVFLWQNSSSQLTGGINAGWNDSRKDIVYDLFITAPF